MYDDLRSKWRELMIATPDYDLTDSVIVAKIAQITEKAQVIWCKMVSDSTSILWNDFIGEKKSSQITASYRRIKELAIAYNTLGSSLYGDDSLGKAIIFALDWMYINSYNETISKYGNWWDWEIGAPMALNDCMVLMYDWLTPGQINNYIKPIDRFSPDSTKTGANRVWKCKVVGIRGIVGKNTEKIANSRDALAPLFTYSATIGDGYSMDGSFLQHNNHPYTIGYGSNLLYDLADLLQVYSVSNWDIPKAYLKIIFRWIFESYEPLVHKGAGMDMVRGREIARFFNEDHVAGHMVIRAIMRIMKLLPSVDSKKVEAVVKSWIESDTFLDFYSNPASNLYDVLCAKAILKKRDVKEKEQYRLYKQFPGMDRVVKHGNGFAYGISMHSARISNYEGDVNNENLKGWHTGDGMTYLYNDDLQQFSDNFWPTVDAYRLPGTTVLSRTSSDSDVTNGMDWVGGTDLNNRYGITGMAFKAIGFTLKAYKSWFMCDSEIVALGADISASDHKVVETIIENRKLKSCEDNILKVNGKIQPVGCDWSERIDRVEWVHLEGNATGADIGYYFPDNTEVNFLREKRTGQWSEVNNKGGYYTTDKWTRNYLTMYIDHGLDASTTSNYAYVILPGASSARVSMYAGNPDITVLCNNRYVQAVKKKSLNMTAANFWEDTIQTVDGITCNKKASVIVKDDGAVLEVSVSDPTQTNRDTIILELNKTIVSVVDKDQDIEVDDYTSCSSCLKLIISVNDSKGKAFKASFALK